MLPERFFKPTRDGALSDQSLNFEKMENAKRYYYHLMGWDKYGVPMPEKLEELGIDHWRTTSLRTAIQAKPAKKIQEATKALEKQALKEATEKDK